MSHKGLKIVNQLLSLSLVVVTPLLSLAHDLEYTLTQNGYSKEATCTRNKDSIQTPNVIVMRKNFKGSKRSKSFLIFTSRDEDQDLTREFLLETNSNQKGHDVEVFSSLGVKFELTVVGEGKVPATLKLSKSESALNVWMNTYGIDGTKFTFDCE